MVQAKLISKVKFILKQFSCQYLYFNLKICTFTEFLVASVDKEKLLSRDKIEKSFKLIDEV
jgi:hypothetical protein